MEKGLNITWWDKVCNDEVLRRVGEERDSGSVIPYGIVILSH